MDDTEKQQEITATERRLAPSCMESSAASTPARSVRPVTNRSSGRRPCRNRSVRYGKSRSGRQSPYQEDFSEPPRPNTSSRSEERRVGNGGAPTGAQGT